MRGWIDYVRRLRKPHGRGSFVADVQWERNEELRPERLGPSDEDIRRDDPFWKPPPAALRDSGRPTTHI